MKVIFLDLDGVMITDSYLKRSTDYEGYLFTPSCVKYLKEIMEETSAQIVVSSTYRMAGFRYLQKMFESNGINQGLVGQTPVIEYGIRGDEIQQYIEESRLDPELKVEQFVIIDDHNNMGHLSPYLVLTKGSIGLDEEARDQVIQMFKKGGE